MSMDCPVCGEPDLDRESVDVEVGIIYGPYGCYCGWSEWECYDQTKGPTATSGKRTDQWGYLYPTDEAAPGARDSDVVAVEDKAPAHGNRSLTKGSR